MSDEQTTPPTGAQTTTGDATTPIDPKILHDFGLTAQQITDMETKYSVPASVRAGYPDLVALLIKTESMNPEEREYWFQVLPIMNDEQIVKLRTILVNEREQLKKIDEEYNSEIGKINQAHKSEWNAFEAQEKRKILSDAEKKHEEQETENEDALLQKLQNVDEPSEVPAGDPP